jgi:hypothetical protein
MGINITHCQDTIIPKACPLKLFSTKSASLPVSPLGNEFPLLYIAKVLLRNLMGRGGERVSLIHNGCAALVGRSSETRWRQGEMGSDEFCLRPENTELKLPIALRNPKKYGKVF